MGRAGPFPRLTLEFGSRLGGGRGGFGLSLAGRILMPRMVTLRADPWAPDYGMGFDAAGEEPAGAVDTSVETDDWSAPLSVPQPEGGPVWFVDGVRRVELRLVAQDSGRRASGLFGSYAVGSVVCDGRATFGEHLVCRSVVLGGGLPAQRVEVSAGGHRLTFDPSTDQRHDPNAPLDRLQSLMREAEAALAARTALPAGAVALIDGPLHFYEEPGASVVGVIKRFVRQYLGPDQEDLLTRLGPGQRTPVFALLDLAENPQWFSWYSRIAPVRVPLPDHAGIVRCEVGAAVGPARAVELAGVVTWLRHRMGDRRLIRRVLTEWLTAHASKAGEAEIP